MKDLKRDMSGLMDDAAAFRQQVRMAAVQVAGLRPEELAQALAYEVEPLSGVPAAEAEVVYKPIADADPTVRVFDVAVKRRRRRSSGAGRLERWLGPLIVLACLVIAGLALDGILLARRESHATHLVAERRPLQAQLDRLRADTQKMRLDAQAIRARRESVSRAQDAAAERRRAHADFLEALAASCEERAVVTAIVSSDVSGKLTVRAIGTSVSSAAETMRLMTARGATCGWRIVPGPIEASATGATVTFAFDGVWKR